MYTITAKTELPGETLKHTKNIFHLALKGGEKRYHVTGAPLMDYDLVYMPNNEVIPQEIRERKKGIDIYPAYKKYDENDTANIDLSLLKAHSRIYLETLDEYVVVIARLALKHTEAVVYSRDKLILNFLPQTDRVIIVEEFPPLGDNRDDVLQVTEEFICGSLAGSYHKLNMVPVFHSLFFRQSLTDRPLSDIRYVEIRIAPNVGIGGVLNYYAMAKSLFAPVGWTVFLKENATRYPDELLEKYFAFIHKPADSNETNTVYINEVLTLTDTYACSLCASEIDESILSSQFRREMEEYSEVVLSGHHVLGVLIRGTDYIAAKMNGARKMATADDMIPLIKQWIAEDGYDRIFLATEDQDILDKMRQEFGSMVVAVSQIRHRVADFKTVNMISDLEKEKTSPEEYAGVLEDNMVNYFYALFILSRCESFMASGQCHGWSVANSFNHGKFKRAYKFQVGVK